jgi:hypothetical protein
MLRGSKFLTGAAFAVMTAAIFAAGPAQAIVSVDTGGGNLADSTNVLFDSVVIGNPVYGDLSGGAQDVIVFSSTTDTLKTDSSGQAKITSVDYVPGPSDQDVGGINQLTITSLFPPYLGFEALQLNLFGETGVIVNFSAVDQFNNVYNFGPYSLGTGENRFTFTSDATQYITSLSFTTDAGEVALFDARQVRIGDLVAVPGPLVGAGLPGLLAGCFGLLALARRRRAMEA